MTIFSARGNSSFCSSVEMQCPPILKLRVILLIMLIRPTTRSPTFETAHETLNIGQPAFNPSDRNRATSPSSLLSNPLKDLPPPRYCSLYDNPCGRSAISCACRILSSLRRKMKLRLHSKPVWDSVPAFDPSFFLQHRGRPE
jgi:hypothetical protein